MDCLRINGFYVLQTSEMRPQVRLCSFHAFVHHEIEITAIIAIKFERCDATLNRNLYCDRPYSGLNAEK